METSVVNGMFNSPGAYRGPSRSTIAPPRDVTCRSSRFCKQITPGPTPRLKRRILAEGDCELIVADKSKTDAESLAKLAAPCDGIMTNLGQGGRGALLGPRPSAASSPVSASGWTISTSNIARNTRSSSPTCRTIALLKWPSMRWRRSMRSGGDWIFYHHATKSGRYELQAGRSCGGWKAKPSAIVGFGAIGQCLAKKLLPLGFKVLAFNRSRKRSDGRRRISRPAGPSTRE